MIQVFNLKTKLRAASLAALFFISTVFGHPAFGAPTESYKDIIEKAYNLSLQKDRTQAMSILLGALKKEKKSSVAQKELTAGLNQVSKFFYGEKAQQLYELAISLRATDLNLSVAKLQEASRLEPDNLSIEMAVARNQISSGDCDGAVGRLTKYKDHAAFIEELRLVMDQGAVCTGKFLEYVAHKGEIDLKKSTYSLFWMNLEAEYLFRTAAFSKIIDLTDAIQKIDGNFPEAHYWRWRANVEMKLKEEGVAQKYLSTCKGLNSRQARQYLLEPNLCRHTTEVETFLKKNNNPET